MKKIKKSILVSGLLYSFIVLSGSSILQAQVSVSTVRIYQIMATSPSCSISVTGTPVNENGVCIGTKSGPTVTQKKFTIPAGSRAGTGVLMTGLTAGTKYFVRAYAKSGDKIIYGNELSFTTVAGTSNTGQKKEEKPSGGKK